jgi:hypothetical protein
MFRVEVANIKKDHASTLVFCMYFYYQSAFSSIGDLSVKYIVMHRVLKEREVYEANHIYGAGSSDAGGPVPGLCREDGIKMAPISDRKSDKIISLPYGFYNDSWACRGLRVPAWAPQPQAGFVSTAMVEPRFCDGVPHGSRYQGFGVERLFLDPIVSSGYFVDNNAYINGNPHLPVSRPVTTDRPRIIMSPETAGTIFIA